MNSFVLIASLAIIALAILLPTDAAPSSESHSLATSKSADKDSASTKLSKVTDIGDKLVIQKKEQKSESDDWDTNSSSVDNKEYESCDGSKVKVNVQKSSSKSVDTDKFSEKTENAIVDDPTEC